MEKLPVARSENIVVQTLETELLIYDLMTNKAFCLNETAKVVFEACDGQTSLAELKRRAGLPDEVIYFALDELRRENLLAENYQSKFAGVSRRDVIKRIGLATMIALPVVASLVAPTAAHAASVFCGGDVVCIEAGQNVCAGCTNQTIRYRIFVNSTGDNCSGGSFITTRDCGVDSTTLIRDIRRI